EGELCGQRLHELAHGPGDGAMHHAAADCPLTAALRTGAATGRQHEMLRDRNGHSVAIAWSTTPLLLAGRRVARLTLDVAAERESMVRQRAELEAVIEAIGASVFVCDSAGRVVRLNRRAAEWLGETAEAMLRPFGELLASHELRRPDGLSLPAEER